MQATTQFPSRNSGFALADLLALIACVALLLLFPVKAISSTAQRTHAAVCLNNHRLMISAWTQYADNHSGLLTRGMDGFNIPRANERGLFAPRLLGYKSDPLNYDPASSVALSALAPYIDDYNIWRCPADRSNVPLGPDRLPRVRTISTSQVFDSGMWLPASIYRTYFELPQIVLPSKTWVTIDEHPDSLNDAALAVVMAAPGSTTGTILDFPASFHNGGATMSFADGRVEIHVWKGNRIRPPVSYNGTLSLNVPAGDSLQDIIWLSEHTTVPR